MASWTVQVRVPGAGGSWTTVAIITGLRIRDAITVLAQLDVTCWNLSQTEKDLLKEGNDIRAMADAVEQWYGQIRSAKDDPFNLSRKIQANEKAIILRDRVWLGRKPVGPIAADAAVDEVFESPNGEPSEGMVLYWDMSTLLSDGRMQDLSGNGNHGSVSAGATPGRLGVGRYYAIDGGGIQADDSASLDLTGALTIAMWFKPDSLTAANRTWKVADKGGTGVVGGYYFHVTQTSPLTTAALILEISNGASSQSSTSGEQTFSTTTYKHVAVVFNPNASAGNKVKFYIDGVAVGTPADITISPSANTNVLISQATLISLCKTDELVIYNRALSLAEVQSLALQPPPLAGGFLGDVFDPITFRAEEDDRLTIIDGIARTVSGEWYVDRDGADKDRFRFVKRRGSPLITDVYSFPTLVSVEQKLDREIVRNHIVVLGAGDAAGQVRAETFHATLVRTSLTAAALAGDTTLTVSDTAAFPANGILYVGQERIKYTGKTSTTFTTLTRAYSGDGTSSLPAYDHSSGIEVYLHGDTSTTPTTYYSITNPGNGSSIKLNGLRQARLTDRSIAVQDTADRFSQRLLFAYKDVRESVVASVVEDSITAVLGDQVDLYVTKAAAPSSGLQLRYNMSLLFDDGRMQDLSGNGNHGTITGTTDVLGKFGRARSYPGGVATDNISPGDVLDFGTGPFTVAGWVKTNAGTGTRRWAAKRNTGSAVNRGWSCYFASTGIPIMEIEANGSAVSNIQGPAAKNDNVYHHIACVFDRDGSTQAVLSLYVDGILVTGPTTFATQNGAVDNAETLKIGNDSNTNCWLGDIDEPRIWNRALTGTEIADLAAAQPYQNTPYRIMDIQFTRDESTWRFELENPRDLEDYPLSQLREESQRAGAYGQKLATAPNAIGFLTNVNVPTTTETSLVSATALGVRTGQRVLVRGWVQLTTGATTTTVTSRIRRGVGTGGALVGEANAEGVKIAAGGTEPFLVEVIDVAPSDDPAYSFTVQQAGATGAGTALQGTITAIPLPP